MTPIDDYDDDLGGKPTTPVLTTKGLVLSRATVDLPDYSAWLNDPEVVKFSELRHKKHSWEDCKAYISSFDGIDNHMWSIMAIGANCHIGNITLHIDRPNGVGDLGILLGEKWAWGRKYGREAWSAVHDWARKPTTDGGAGLRYCTAGAMATNEGVHRMISLSKMKHISNIPNYFVLDGKFITKRIYMTDLG